MCPANKRCSTAAANQGTSAFDPYGTVLGTSGTQGLFGYQGDLTDPVTAGVDMGTRHYVPGLGRFSTRDSLTGQVSAPMSLNRHVYAVANPVTMTDPTGMRPWCESCSTRQNQRLTYAWSIGRSSASTGNPVSWSSAWSQAKDYLPPKPPPPEPAPKIDISSLMARKGGVVAPSTSGCARRCGSSMSFTTPTEYPQAQVGEGGCDGFWSWCTLGRGAKAAGSFVWEHKELIAAGVCIAASFGACAAATSGVVLATEVELFAEGASGKEHAANVALGLFSLGLGGVARAAHVEAAALRGGRYAGAVPSGLERAFLGGTINAAPAACGWEENLGSGNCP